MKCVVALLAVLAVAYGFETEEGVFIGTDANIADLLASTEFVLVEFYAPWCGHCKQLAPEYNKAAKQLSDLTNVKLVKIDATIHSKIAEEHEIQGYPTLKWFRNGKASDYGGGRTTADIVNWIRKKSGPAATTLASVDDATKFQSSNEVYVVGYFTDANSADAKTFVEAAALGELAYAITSDAAVAAHFNVAADSITLFKPFDEKRADYTGSKSDASAINTFVGANSLPLVNEFSDETAPKIFGGAIKTHILLFADKGAADFSTLNSALATTAAKYRGKALFVLVDSTVGDHGRILEFFNLQPSDCPAVRLIELSGNMAKYKFEGPITADSLNSFVSSFFAGTLKRHLNSQETPADWDAKPVKILTGKNFADVALNPNKAVFVEFYAPWCGHCKELSPTWDSLAEKFASNSDIVIAKIDSTANEVEQVSVQSFPTLKFFPKGDKTPVDYNGGRDLEALTAFVEEQTKSAGKSKDGKDEL